MDAGGLAYSTEPGVKRDKPRTHSGGSMDANALKGMAVISLQEGTQLGRVEHGLFNLATRQLGALAVHGDTGTFIVPFAQLENIGADAITVSSSQVTQTPSTGGALDGLLGFDGLQKLKIIDQSGAFLGTIETLELDPASGQITQLVAHKGGLLGLGGTTTPLDAGAILTVGPDVLTVSSSAPTA
jgi:sporulation protein YlmC with PRC-barrel domain